MNAAVHFYETVLRRRRPQPREVERYTTVSHAFSDLRKFSYMTRAQMAAKLGISESMLQKIESGMVGGNPNLDIVERSLEIAGDYRLHSVIRFLNLYRNHLRTKPRRGPRPAGRDEKWYMPEREGVT